MTDITDTDRGFSYGFSAVVASALPAHLWWGPFLSGTISEGPLAPLGFTAAALLVTWAVDWMYDTWLFRMLAFVPITALVASPEALHAVLAFATGAAS
jgi:hypothetical protein